MKPIPTSFIFKKRIAKKIQKSDTRVNQLTKLFLAARSTKRPTSQGMILNMDIIVENIASNNFNENIFLSEQKAKGGKIFLFVDCSGSMRNHQPSTRNFCYDLFLAIEKTKVCELEIIAFSSKMDSETSVLDVIKKPSDCNRIIDEDDDLHDHLGLGLESYAKYISAYQGKKAIIVLTDGYPEANGTGGKKLPVAYLVEYIKREIIKIENQKAKFFALFVGRYATNDLKLLFRNKFYQSKDLNEGLDKMVIKINDFLKSL